MRESELAGYAKFAHPKLRMEEMGNESLIGQLFGDETLEYFKRKCRGGASGAKGIVYENHFAVYQLAYLVPEDLQVGSNVHVETQLDDFVDDIVVSDFKLRIRKHYQLKNSASVSWAGGDHPISDDFRMQKELNDHLCFSSTTTTLVCSDSARADRLSQQIPAEISNHSEVENFCYGETLNATLQIEPKLFDAIKNLCAFADTDKVERLGALILGVWSANCGQISSVSELWALVERYELNYVRSDGALTIPAALSTILMQINGFSYTIQDGYFVWKQAGLHMEGTFPFPIDSKQFEELSSKIVEVSPTEIEDLEDLLV